MVAYMMVVVVVMVSPAPPCMEPGEQVVDVWHARVGRDAVAAVQPLPAELVVRLALALWKMIQFNADFVCPGRQVSCPAELR